jgi:hypothetical protein
MNLLSFYVGVNNNIFYVLILPTSGTSQHILEQVSDTKFHENPSGKSRADTRVQANGRMNGRTDKTRLTLSNPIFLLTA